MEPTDSAVITGVMTVDEVVSAVCAMSEKRGVSMNMEWLRSPDRQSMVTIPRQIAMYFCRNRCAIGIAEIGRTFNRHHTTVIHSCHKVKSMMAFDKEVRSMVKGVYVELGQEDQEEVKPTTLLQSELKQIDISRRIAPPPANATKKQRKAYNDRAYLSRIASIHFVGSGCRCVSNSSRGKVVSLEAFTEGYDSENNNLCMYCRKHYERMNGMDI